jgi:DNA-directed RNA polymerase specialized sigma24 family protein
VRTFVEHVVANRLASVIAAGTRRLPCLPLEAVRGCSTAYTTSNVDLRADISRAVSLLPPPERRVALLLMHYSPSEVGRLLGIARSTVYARIEFIRAAFLSAGLAPGRDHQ